MNGLRYPAFAYPEFTTKKGEETPAEVFTSILVESNHEGMVESLLDEAKKRIGDKLPEYQCHDSFDKIFEILGEGETQ